MNNTNSRNIVYVGSPALFSKGASSIHMMKMCQAMTRLGINVELVFPNYDKKKDIFKYYGINDKFPIKTIPFTSIPGRQIIHGLLSSFYCASRKSSFDLVVTRNIVFTYFATCWFGIPTIYDAHHPLVNGAAQWLFKRFKDSDNLICFSTNSGGLADIYLAEGLDENKLVVAHNGVDLERFEIPGTVGELRKELGLPENKKIVCYSGNTYSGRGLELLIDVAERFEDIHFLVVGGLDEDNVKYADAAKSRNIENFQLTGFVPHSSVPMYLRATDILVIPYTKEITIKGGTRASEFTSPIKLFEYMASGRPIITSSIPTINEVLEDRETALFFEPGNLNDFSSKLEELLANPVLSKTLSENSTYKVSEYTWEARVKKILKIPFL